MRHRIEPFTSLTIYLVGGILTQPAWLMALFLFLVCLVPFAGGTMPYRGDASQFLDPFAFSLLTPSNRAFGPVSMLALAGIFIIPSAMIYWRNTKLPSMLFNNSTVTVKGILPFSACCLYFLILLLGLPLIVQSSAFQGPADIAISMFDLVLIALSVAWVASFTMSRVQEPGLRSLVVWMVIGAYHLVRCMTDEFLIAPGIRDLIEGTWTLVVWHGILAVVAFTLHSVQGPSRQEMIN